MENKNKKEREQEDNDYNNSSSLYTTPTTDWPFAKKQPKQ
jgi:hypothetical protein